MPLSVARASAIIQSLYLYAASDSTTMTISTASRTTPRRRPSVGERNMKLRRGAAPRNRQRCAAGRHDVDGVRAGLQLGLSGHLDAERDLDGARGADGCLAVVAERGGVPAIEPGRAVEVAELSLLDLVREPIVARVAGQAGVLRVVAGDELELHAATD